MIGGMTRWLRVGAGALVVGAAAWVAAGATPDALLGRRVGKTITVVTDRGEITGTLRAFDSDALVVEVGSGKDAAVEILRRGDHIVDVKLPLDEPLLDQPTLAWRVT